MLFAARLVQASPPADLQITGVPDLSQGFLDSVGAYDKAKATLFMGWDPTADRMLVASLDGSKQQLHVLLAPNGDTRLATLFPGIIGSGSFVPKTGDLVIFGADHNGDEDYQLYSLNAANGQTTLLTDGHSCNNEVTYSHSGVQIAFRSTMVDTRYADICVMNPRVPHSTRILMQVDRPGWALQDWAHDDQHVLASHAVSINDGYLWQINSITGETTLLTKDRATQRRYLEARFTPNDDAIWVVVSESGQPRIEWLPIKPGALPPKIPTTTGDVLDLALSPDGTHLAYTVRQGDVMDLHIFDTTNGGEEPASGLPRGLISRLRWNGNGTELGFSLGGFDRTTQACSYTLANHQMVQWTSPGLLPPPHLAVKPESISLNSFDGLAISGYIYRPDPARFPGRRPVIVNIHGGPAAEYVPSYSPMVNYYVNEQGVAMVFPNVRGSTGFGEHFEELDNGKLREDSVKDIGAFLDWIQNDPHLDAQRVGVQGGSYGGYMVLAALYHYGNRLRCGSDAMGITDFVTFLKNTEEHRQANRRYEYGDERFPDMNAFLQSVSPLNHVAEINDPVLITAGKNDPRVPESESDQMVTALRARNNIVWYILGESEGHGFHDEADADYQTAAEAMFFQTYLLPEKRLTPLLPEAVGAATSGTKPAVAQAGNSGCD